MAQENAYWRAPELGEAKLLLEQGRLRYHDRGQGPPIVFVHGLLVNANLWRKVVGELAADFRCIALDMPLGAQCDAMPEDADLSPTGLADLVADAIDALDLEDVTLVGNDTGGAICQLVVTRRPDRIGRLVLTNCDAFENFPPKAVQPFMPLLRLPGFLTVMLQPTRLEAVRKRGLKMMNLVKRPLDRQEAVDSYSLPAVLDGGVRRDAKRALGGMKKGMLVETSESLADFNKPALIAWAPEDGLFPPRYAKRLDEVLPDSRLEWIDDSKTFVSEDQPDRLAELIRSFVREPAAA
jgi:pimeloyl-ACP methyl ester carboxylesterase